MGAKYTEAQKKATAKYQKTLANISIKISHEDYAKYKEAAERRGQSLREFVLTSMQAAIRSEYENVNDK